jgi:hypothetical protein
LALFAKTVLGGANIEAAIATYTSDGWKCDRAALESLRSVRTSTDIALVHSVVKTLYEPWLDASARHFQELVALTESTARSLVSGTTLEKDACIVFADGLRFDIAGMVKERLEAKGLRVRLGHRLAPLPTVTATAKPFATVVHAALEGGADVADFNPQFRVGNQAATAQRLRDEMAKRGLDLLGDETRPPKNGMVGAWVETGRLDELGHKLGIRLAAQLEMEIEALIDRISALLDCGWLRIRLEWIVRAALEARRRVKEQQKRCFKSEFRNTHFSYILGPEGVEQFISTPELHSDEAIESDPLPPGQVWAVSPGSGESGPGLYRIEVTSGPGAGVKILNQPPPPSFRESVRVGEQNLYARAKELVGDRNPREHEFSIQMRSMDADKTGAGLGLSILVALCGALLGRNTRGGTVIVGALNLGGSIEMIPNAVRIAELTVDQQAQTLRILPLAFLESFI